MARSGSIRYRRRRRSKRFDSGKKRWVVSMPIFNRRQTQIVGYKDLFSAWAIKEKARRRRRSYLAHESRRGNR